MLITSTKVLSQKEAYGSLRESTLILARVMWRKSRRIDSVILVESKTMSVQLCLHSCQIIMYYRCFFLTLAINIQENIYLGLFIYGVIKGILSDYLEKKNDIFVSMK